MKIAARPDGTCACTVSTADGHLPSASPEVRACEQVLASRPLEAGVRVQTGDHRLTTAPRPAGRRSHRTGTPSVPGTSSIVTTGLARPPVRVNSPESSPRTVGDPNSSADSLPVWSRSQQPLHRGFWHSKRPHGTAPPRTPERSPSSAYTRRVRNRHRFSAALTLSRAGGSTRVGPSSAKASVLRAGRARGAPFAHISPTVTHPTTPLVRPSATTRI